ncbi:TetR/AcrR family transcriptional regulator [Rhizobium sp. P38BS-XIX]|uniref:TetR/AcrR family transcriptional regulator n=1 Tax=Rhizobium sp. P38BS-XIX TaxID=2726740 RepID=UPI001456DA2C|nr:TetR/AcrR family transcriptional regulator [Rhizobium sp. P38BS-XIX]NLS01523.1 TetR/AcrR family transcriptional regulator [Rhizobium sp. P38BS-XIX]
MPRGRPRQFDRDKALQDAMLVFWRNGYHAASMPDLCGAMGIDVKSLYAAFGNKEKLFEEAVGLYMKATQNALWAHLAKGDPVCVGLKNMFASLTEIMTDSANHPVGCWTTLALVDEDMPSLVVRAIRKARSDWLDVIGACLDAAKETGELPASADVRSLTRFYVATVQGIGIQAHDGATKAELDGLAATAMSVWPDEMAAA